MTKKRCRRPGFRAWLSLLDGIIEGSLLDFNQLKHVLTGKNIVYASLWGDLGSAKKGRYRQ
jgi:hypothetical protein